MLFPRRRRRRAIPLKETPVILFLVLTLAPQTTAAAKADAASSDDRLFLVAKLDHRTRAENSVMTEPALSAAAMLRSWPLIPASASGKDF